MTQEVSPDQEEMSEVPLCVDLDGTLCRSDLLVEGLLQMLGNSPLRLLQMVGVYWSNRPKLKKFVAEATSIDADTLPWNQTVLGAVRTAKSHGRKVFLVTASFESVAREIVRTHPEIDGVYATSEDHNLKGEAKAALLSEVFGVGRFDYIGDSRADIPIFALARESFVVGPRAKALAKRNSSVRTLPESGSHVSSNSWARAIRPHQWSKNLLLFAPVILAHAVTFPNLMLALLAAISFSATASSVYLLNDLLDLQSDRNHPRKRLRPFASGDLTPIQGLKATILLGVVALAIGSTLGARFLAILLVYLISTTMYSISLKKIPVLDILTLSSLYAVRLWAGGVAVEVPLSHWLLTFSLFFFFSIAAAKRYAELLASSERGGEANRRRGYKTEDLEFVRSLGTSCGITSILILALYVTSPRVTELYSTPAILLLQCPLLLYWVGRIWLLANRGTLDEDPVLFAIKDRTSYMVGGLALLILVWST